DMMCTCRQSMLVSLVVVASVVVSLNAKTPHHGHFEYNARKMGNRKITVLSIRRDPFRDRRSILEQTSGPFHKSLASEILEARLKEEKSRARHGRRHGHGDYKRRKEEEALKETILEAEREYLESINERTSESRSSNVLTDLSNIDILERVSEGKLFPRYPNVFSNITDDQMLKPKRSRSRRPRKKSGKKKRLRRKNNTEKSQSRSRSRSRTRTKNREDRRNNKNRSRGKNREGRRSCRGLKGAEKKECRKNRKNHHVEGSEKVDSQISIIKQMSGSEACQYHNLQFCAEQSNLLEKSPDDIDLYTRCNLRMDFLLCMESQRDPAKTTPCSPDFKISGDMSYIRNRIREVVQSSSSSCLLP
ncbi:unnamed protein product, partial [Meganyctiphanes norvegica]